MEMMVIVLEGVMVVEGMRGRHAVARTALSFPEQKILVRYFCVNVHLKKSFRHFIFAFFVKQV